MRSFDQSSWFLEVHATADFSVLGYSAQVLKVGITCIDEICQKGPGRIANRFLKRFPVAGMGIGVCSRQGICPNLPKSSIEECSLDRDGVLVLHYELANIASFRGFGTSR